MTKIRRMKKNIHSNVQVKPSQSALNKGGAMGSISFDFPQIVFESKDFEATHEEIEDLKNMGTDEKTDWIWVKMDESDRAFTQGKNWVKSFIDGGLCGIKF